MTVISFVACLLCTEAAPEEPYAPRATKTLHLHYNHETIIDRLRSDDGFLFRIAYRGLFSLRVKTI